MKRHDRLRRLGRLLFAAALLAGLTGCSLNLAMSPLVSSAELGGRQLPYKVALVLDDEFKSYRWHGFSGAEMAKLHYDLGSASKDLFLMAFGLVADEVVLVEIPPPYSEPERSAIAIAVRPRIAGFSERHSLWIRNADYYAEITYHVTVYDHSGRTILDQDFSAEGVAMGWSDLNRNYEAPVEKAMEQAIGKIVAAVSALHP